jgi:hypothetical protein
MYFFPKRVYFALLATAICTASASIAAGEEEKLAALETSATHKIPTSKHIERLTGIINPTLDNLLLKPTGREFVLEEWAKAGNPYKQFMLYDLIHSHSIVGMNKAQVHELLGLPSGDPYSKQFASDENVEAYHCAVGLYFQVLYLDGTVHGFRLKSLTPRYHPPTYTVSKWVTKNLNR